MLLRSRQLSRFLVGKIQQTDCNMVNPMWSLASHRRQQSQLIQTDSGLLLLICHQSIDPGHAFSNIPRRLHPMRGSQALITSTQWFSQP